MKIGREKITICSNYRKNACDISTDIHDINDVYNRTNTGICTVTPTSTPPPPTPNSNSNSNSNSSDKIEGFNDFIANLNKYDHDDY